MNEENNKEVDYKFKVVLVGDSNSGKSTLLSRLIHKENFSLSDSNNNTSVSNTIGVDFKSETVSLEKSNVRVMLNFYDTSGAEQYRQIAQSYTENVQAFLFVYDVRNMASFLNCQYWLDEITKKHKCNLVNQEAEDDSAASKSKKSKKKPVCCNHLIKILVGCKNDLDYQKEGKQVVSTKKAKQFAKKKGFCLFYETSAKDNLNIKELFEELSIELISNYINYLNNLESTLNLISVPSSTNTSTNSSSSSSSYMLTQMPIPLRGLTTKSDVYYNCKTERLNCNHIIFNNKNSKRKNLQYKGLLDLF